MPEITRPATVRFANVEWSQPPSYSFNRSELTGKSRAVQLGPADRWTATARLVPTKRDDFRSVRAFLALMKLPGNYVNLQMVEADQRQNGMVPPNCQVNGSGQLGLSLNVKGLLAGATNLSAGDILMVAFATDDVQPIVLGADLVANGSGLATATLTTPLRRSPADNAAIELSRPWATMRMRDPMRWQGTPGGIYTAGDSVSFEEAF